MGRRICCGGGTAAFFRFVVGAAGAGREVRAARPQPIIGLLALRALRRRFSGDGASGCRQAGRWERTSARRPFGGRRRAGPAPAGERTRCIRSSDTPRPGGSRDICASIRQCSLPHHRPLQPRLARRRGRREAHVPTPVAAPHPFAITLRPLGRLAVPFGKKIALVAKRRIEWRRRGIETVSLAALRRAFFRLAQIGHGCGRHRDDVGRTRIELERPFHFDRALLEMPHQTSLSARRETSLNGFRPFTGQSATFFASGWRERTRFLDNRSRVCWYRAYWLSWEVLYLISGPPSFLPQAVRNGDRNFAGDRKMRIPSARHLILTSVIGLLSATSASAVELISNGGFEIGNFTPQGFPTYDTITSGGPQDLSGWTVGNSLVWGWNPTDINVYDEHGFVDLTGVGDTVPHGTLVRRYRLWSARSTLLGLYDVVYHRSDQCLRERHADCPVGALRNLGRYAHRRNLASGHRGFHCRWHVEHDCHRRAAGILIHDRSRRRQRDRACGCGYSGTIQLGHDGGGLRGTRFRGLSSGETDVDRDGLVLTVKVVSTPNYGAHPMGSCAPKPKVARAAPTGRPPEPIRTSPGSDGLMCSRAARALHPYARDIILEPHAHSPHNTHVHAPFRFPERRCNHGRWAGWRPCSRVVSAPRAFEPVGRPMGV